MTKITREFLISLVGKTIEFNSKIDDYEIYAEPGMKAIVTKWNFDDRDSDPIHKLYLDFAPFEETNHPRQSANYFDKSGNACLTAVEAGYYSPQGWIYLDEFLFSLPFSVVNE